MEDLIAIYEYLDRKKCVLPRYVAADLNKIPNVRAADADVCTITMQMMKMQEDIEQMRSQICCVVKECKEVAEGVKDVERSVSRTKYNDPKCYVDNSASMSGQLPKPEENQRYQLNTKKLLEVIKEWESNDWQTVQKKNKFPPKFGTEDNSTGKVLKAAKTKRTWHFYVGNLNSSTISYDIREYLETSGIDVFSCEPVGDGHWDERPAAFHVEVDYEKKDAVIMESFWDVGVRVRNWYFPKRKL